ncbi:hypothetical protein CLV63_12312 [Murinocardiopsis flavida]|uniref:Uncharacterized protein n=1 Tax=Murinocardiopsis flavida TaxID=645275 RepID=A0A2P8CYZ4_9ACTN|nr:hypothetical protein CLV63_12312 [Murinocardiopsis flavida]
MTRNAASRPGAPPVRRAELGTDSGLIGAARAVHAAAPSDTGA